MSVANTSHSVAELQQSLRAGAGDAPDILAWTHGLVAAAPHGGGAAATANPDRVVVIAAHSGAGASTIALAIADAAATSTSRPVHLIEMCEPTRSGLAATAHSELGVVSGGAWRRGRRGPHTIIDRPTVLAPASERAVLLSAGADTTVVDYGLPAWSSALRIAPDRLVVVTRATVPGVRATERLLAELSGMAAAVAIIGPERWPGEVRASVGTQIRRLIEAQRLVPVPYSKRLEAHGLDHRDLPPNVAKSAAALLARCARRTSSPDGAAEVTVR